MVPGAGCMDLVGTDAEQADADWMTWTGWEKGMELCVCFRMLPLSPTPSHSRRLYVN